MKRLKSIPSTHGVSLDKKLIALFLCFCMAFSQTTFAEVSSQLPVTSGQKESNSGNWEKETGFIQSISIPQELGTLEETYSAPSPNPRQRRGPLQILSEVRSKESDSLQKRAAQSPSPKIIYIQDAHDSLEAQENIAKIIHHLVENHGVKTVFEEGYEGKVPTDEFFSIFKDPQAKEKVSYFLMDKLRMGGAEYAHVNRTKPFELIGVDSLKLHKENIEWYKKSAETRELIEKDLEAIHKEIKVLVSQHFPKELKSWMKLKDRLDRGRIDLLDYLRRITSHVIARSETTKQSLGREIATLLTEARNDGEGTYPNIELLLTAESSQDPKVIEQTQNINPQTLFKEIDQLENDYAHQYLTYERDKKIYQIHKALTLLGRLNRIEVTSEEYVLVEQALKELSTKKIAKFLFEVTGKPVIFSNLWERHIQSAIQFYKVAEKRDEVLKDLLIMSFPRRRESKGNGSPTESFGDDNAPSIDSFGNDNAPSILIFGGFHKNKIKTILKENNFSYMIVTPKITEISEVHQSHYKHLMAGGHHTFETPFFVARAAPAERALAMMSSNRFASYLSKSKIARTPSVARALASETRSINEEAKSLFESLKQSAEDLAQKTGEDSNWRELAVSFSEWLRDTEGLPDFEKKDERSRNLWQKYFLEFLAWSDHWKHIFHEEIRVEEIVDMAMGVLESERKEERELLKGFQKTFLDYQNLFDEHYKAYIRSIETDRVANVLQLRGYLAFFSQYLFERYKTTMPRIEPFVDKNWFSSGSEEFHQQHWAARLGQNYSWRIIFESGDPEPKESLHEYLESLPPDYPVKAFRIHIQEKSISITFEKPFNPDEASKSETRAIRMGEELTAEDSFLTEKQKQIFVGTFEFIRNASKWISEQSGEENPFDLLESSETEIVLNVLPHDKFMQKVRGASTLVVPNVIDSFVEVDSSDLDNPRLLLQFNQNILDLKFYPTLITTLSNLLIGNAVDHAETIKDTVVGDYIPAPEAEQQVEIYQRNIEFLKGIANYLEQRAEEGYTPEMNRSLAKAIREDSIPEEEKALRVYLQQLLKQDPTQFSEQAIPFILKDSRKDTVSWVTAYPDFPKRAARQLLKRLPLASNDRVHKIQTGEINEMTMGLATPQGFRELDLNKTREFAIKHKLRLRMDNWDYQIQKGGVLVTHAVDGRTYTSEDSDFQNWLEITLQIAIFAVMSGLSLFPAQRYHEFDEKEVRSFIEDTLEAVLKRSNREIFAPKVPAPLNQLEVIKKQKLLFAKVAFKIAEHHFLKKDEPILELPTNEDFFARRPSEPTSSETRSDPHPEEVLLKLEHLQKHQLLEFFSPYKKGQEPEEEDWRIESDIRSDEDVAEFLRRVKTMIEMKRYPQLRGFIYSFFSKYNQGDINTVQRGASWEFDVPILRKYEPGTDDEVLHLEATGFGRAASFIETLGLDRIENPVERNVRNLSAIREEFMQTRLFLKDNMNQFSLKLLSMEGLTEYLNKVISAWDSPSAPKVPRFELDNPSAKIEDPTLLFFRLNPAEGGADLALQIPGASHYKIANQDRNDATPISLLDTRRSYTLLFEENYFGGEPRFRIKTDYILPQDEDYMIGDWGVNDNPILDITADVAEMLIRIYIAPHLYEELKGIFPLAGYFGFGLDEIAFEFVPAVPADHPETRLPKSETRMEVEALEKVIYSSDDFNRAFIHKEPFFVFGVANELARSFLEVLNEREYRGNAYVVDFEDFVKESLSVKYESKVIAGLKRDYNGILIYGYAAAKEGRYTTVDSDKALRILRRIGQHHQEDFNSGTILFSEADLYEDYATFTDKQKDSDSFPLVNYPKFFVFDGEGLRRVFNPESHSETRSTRPSALLGAGAKELEGEGLSLPKSETRIANNLEGDEAEREVELLIERLKNPPSEADQIFYQTRSPIENLRIRRKLPVYHFWHYDLERDNDLEYIERTEYEIWVEPVMSDEKDRITISIARRKAKVDAKSWGALKFVGKIVLDRSDASFEEILKLLEEKLTQNTSSEIRSASSRQKAGGQAGQARSTRPSALLGAGAEELTNERLSLPKSETRIANNLEGDEAEREVELLIERLKNPPSEADQIFYQTRSPIENLRIRRKLPVYHFWHYDLERDNDLEYIERTEYEIWVEPVGSNEKDHITISIARRKAKVDAKSWEPLKFVGSIVLNHSEESFQTILKLFQEKPIQNPTSETRSTSSGQARSTSSRQKAGGQAEQARSTRRSALLRAGSKELAGEGLSVPKSETRNDYLNAEEAYELLKQNPPPVVFSSPEKALNSAKEMVERMEPFNIERVVVVGQGSISLILYYLLMGKEVIFVDRDPLMVFVLRRQVEKFEKLLREDGRAIQLKSKLIRSEIGKLNLEAEGLEANSFDLVTMIDLVGERPQGAPKKWLETASRLIKKEGGFLLMDEPNFPSLRKKMMTALQRAFSQYDLLFGGEYFNGTYNTNPTNRFYRVRSEVRAETIGELNLTVSTLISHYYKQDFEGEIWTRALLDHLDDIEPEDLSPENHEKVRVDLIKAVGSLVYLLGEETIVLAFNQDQEHRYENFMNLLGAYTPSNRLDQILDDWSNFDYFNLEKLKEVIVSDLPYVADVFGSIGSGSSARQIRKIYYGMHPEIFNANYTGETPYLAELSRVASIIHDRIRTLEIDGTVWEKNIDQTLEVSDVERVMKWIDSRGGKDRTFYNPGDSFSIILRLLDADPYDVIAGISQAKRVLNLNEVHVDNFRSVFTHFRWAEESGRSLNRIFVFLHFLLNEKDRDLSSAVFPLNAIYAKESELNTFMTEFEMYYDERGLPRSETRQLELITKIRSVVDRASVQNLQGKYVVPVDLDVFEKLGAEQQEEFYKAIEMYSENEAVKFVFIADVRGDRQMTPVWSTVNELSKKYGNVTVKNLTSTNANRPLLETSEIQGRKILGILNESNEQTYAERLKEEVTDSEDLFWLKYLLDSKEAGLLMSAIKLLDSGQDDLVRLKGFFTTQDIPGAIRSEMRSILMTYEAVVSSA